MTGRLEGKVALITGAASGIGRASAIRFVAEGAHVVATDLDQDGLDTLQRHINDPRLEVSDADIAENDHCIPLLQAVLESRQ